MSVFNSTLTDPVYGLIPALRQLDRLNPPAVYGGDWREARSVAMEGGACGEGEILDPCDVETTKTLRASAAPVINAVHVLKDSYTCESDIGPVGLSFESVQSRALRNMDQSSTALFERMFYNDYLSACVSPNAGSPISPMEAMALLLADAIAAGLRRVMIHVPSAVFPSIQEEAVLDRTGALFRLLNHVVVYGDGYPQPVDGVFNIFATSMPYGWVDEPYMLGESMYEILDSTNKVAAITEQDAAVLIDDCFIGCYEATLGESVGTPGGGGGGALPELIFEQVLSADAASIEVTDIPDDGDNLMIVMDVRSAVAAVVDTMAMQFNGDSGPNYDTKYAYQGTSNGSPAYTGQTSAPIGNAPGASANADAFAHTVVYVVAYAAGDGWPSFILTSGTDSPGTYYMVDEAGHWKNAIDAISSISFFAVGGDIAAGSQIRVYKL